MRNLNNYNSNSNPNPFLVNSLSSSGKNNVENLNTREHPNFSPTTSNPIVQEYHSSLVSNKDVNDWNSDDDMNANILAEISQYSNSPISNLDDPISLSNNTLMNEINKPFDSDSEEFRPGGNFRQRILPFTEDNINLGYPISPSISNSPSSSPSRSNVLQEFSPKVSPISNSFPKNNLLYYRINFGNKFSKNSDTETSSDGVGDISPFSSSSSRSSRSFSDLDNGMSDNEEMPIFNVNSSRRSPGFYSGMDESSDSDSDFEPGNYNVDFSQWPNATGYIPRKRY